MTEVRPNVIRDTNEEARALARLLISTAPFAAIAVIDPATGYPNSSRVLTATDNAGYPTILVSGLSAHTRALAASAKCSLLVGEPGKGDPLAWPRLSLQCDAEKIAPDDPARGHLRTRFLRRHKKAALYADFGDFMFFRLIPVSASLNAGFGRAYQLNSADLDLPPNRPPLDEEQENNLIEALEMALNHPPETGPASAEFNITSIDTYGVTFERKGRKSPYAITYPIDNNCNINHLARLISSKIR
jgi:heme iron utilization protein